MCQTQGPWFNGKMSFYQPIVEIRRSWDRLISTMGFPILVRWHLYIEQAPVYPWERYICVACPECFGTVWEGSYIWIFLINTANDTCTVQEEINSQSVSVHAFVIIKYIDTSFMHFPIGYMEYSNIRLMNSRIRLCIQPLYLTFFDWQQPNHRWLSEKDKSFRFM